MVTEGRENGEFNIAGQATKMVASNSNTSRIAICLVVEVCISYYRIDSLVIA